MIPRAAAIAIFAITVVCGSCATRACAMDGGRYGEVRVLEPSGRARGVVIFFSDRRGVTAAFGEAGMAMTKDGAMVIEVDTPSYLHRLDQLNEKCHQLVGDAEGLSHRLQRERNFPAYLTPVLAGVGEGGTLAGLALGQAPAATIAGAISVDPAPALDSRRPICAQIAARPGPREARYRAPRVLQGKWTIALTRAATKADRRFAEELKNADAPVEVRDIDGNSTAAGVLRLLLDPYMVKPPATADIGSLPLTELPVEKPAGLMAIVLSGDGGWRDLDKTIAEDLQRQGVPVVGWDSLRYFWSRKTPEQTARDLAAVMEAYMDKWKAEKVALIGYSFGADVLPFAYNRLPQELRSHVALIALLGLSKSADFEVSVGEILGASPSPGAPAVVPEISRIKPSLIQCFYGQQEKDTACPAIVPDGVEVIRTSGGHHFDGDYAALADRIMTGLKRRSGA